MEAFSKINLEAVGGQLNVAKGRKIVKINGVKFSSDISLPDNLSMKWILTKIR